MKLSELKQGRGYTITGDYCNARFLVIQAGPSPLCLVSGKIDASGESGQTPTVIDGDDDEVLFQFVGWVSTASAPSRITASGFTLFQVDEQPDSADLLVLVHRPGKTTDPYLIALQTSIKPLKDD